MYLFKIVEYMDSCLNYMDSMLMSDVNVCASISKNLDSGALLKIVKLWIPLLGHGITWKKKILW